MDDLTTDRNIKEFQLELNTKRVHFSLEIINKAIGQVTLTTELLIMH